MSTALAAPWLDIPSFAQPGQKHAFADREMQLAKLYLRLVSAGNAVRAGKTGVRNRVVVLGPKGIGKSALVLQALGMLRDELGVVDGQRLTMPVGLPEPQDRERWLVLRVSGKGEANVETIPEAIERKVLSLLDDTRQDIEQNIPHALELPILTRIFRMREATDFAKVKSAMLTLTKTIEYVRFWQGSVQTDKVERTLQTDTQREVAASLEALLKAQGADPRTEEAKVALKLASSYLNKIGTTVTSSIERKSTVEAGWVVEVLNDFFKATNAARIPTILFLDDFDELASSAGPEHEARARVIRSVLGPFEQLAPTCLIVALRSEFMMEDLRRAYDLVNVPPMTRRVAGLALSAWGHVQEPPLSEEEGAALMAIGDRFLERFEHDKPIVNPLVFLQLAAKAAAMAAWAGAPKEPYEFVLDDLTEVGGYEIRKIAENITRSMSETDITLCATGAAVDPEPYELSDRDRSLLVQFGLLRPAMAGNPNDPLIVLDPAFAYLRAAAVPKVGVNGLLSSPKTPASPDLLDGPSSSKPGA